MLGDLDGRDLGQSERSLSLTLESVIQINIMIYLDVNEGAYLMTSMDVPLSSKKLSLADTSLTLLLKMPA